MSAMPPAYRIGIDGGATKTEGILVDAAGAIAARYVGPGCNPNVIGSDRARQVVGDVIKRLIQSAVVQPLVISHTHIYAAGNRTYWREVAATLTEYGHVFTADDSYPVLELATGGRPGLVLHSGTGSFTAARSADGTVHYAGGLGWRLGDPGSGYDIGRRGIARAILELQGWLPRTQVVSAVREQLQLDSNADAATITRLCYTHAEPNQAVASIAPAMLRLVSEGDATALEIILDSIGDLLALAEKVALKLFEASDLRSLPAGLSGPMLSHPDVATALAARSRFALRPLTASPIEGVRQLLMRA